MSITSLTTFPPEGLVDRLERSGLHARVLGDVGGPGVGSDRRLEVRSVNRLVRVELLGPLAELLEPPCWQAVRVCGRQRAVWCGPPRPCDAGLLHGFVLDLIALPPSGLAMRWHRLS